MVRLVCHSHIYELTCYEKHCSEPAPHPGFPIPCHLLLCRHLHGHVSRTCTVLWGNFGLKAAWLLVLLWEPDVQLDRSGAAAASPAIPGPNARLLRRCAGGSWFPGGACSLVDARPGHLHTFVWAAWDGCAAVLAMGNQSYAAYVAM